MSTDKEWLATLKPGDEAAVYDSRAWGCRYCLVRVERVTKTQIVLTGNYRWSLRTGREVGADYGSRHLMPVTQKARDAIEADRLIRDIKHRIDAGELTLEQLRAAYQALGPKEDA